MPKRSILFAIIAMVLWWRRKVSILWLLIHGYLGGIFCIDYFLVGGLRLKKNHMKIIEPFCLFYLPSFSCHAIVWLIE